MAEDTGQIYGNADRDKFKGHFLRSGEVDQFKSELRPDIVHMTKQILAENGVPQSVLNP